VIKDSIDKTWIISAQSPIQEQLINELNEPIFIQGPHRVWLRDSSISYFILVTAGSDVSEDKPGDFNDVSNLSLSVHGGQSKEVLINRQKKLHIQKDGTILGICATGTSSRDSLLSWIRILEQHIPKLKDLNIIFTLKSPSSDLVTLNNTFNTTQTEAKESI
jgi:evolutionarily conserved signaling intermediate in toll pathway, mitochondrial